MIQNTKQGKTGLSWIGIVILALGLNGCTGTPADTSPSAGEGGVLIHEIPPSMDILFTSIRHVLQDPACLTGRNEVKTHFLDDPECISRIYDPEKGFLTPRQLFGLDVETERVVQITDMPWFFIGGQAVDSTSIILSAACSDSNGDGILNDRDQIEIYLLDLGSGLMECLTCGSGLEAINNCDYSHVNRRVIFSARHGSVLNLNHLYTIDFQKTLVQLTGDSEYMDFDCSWSEDGTKIVFSRLPPPWFEKPSQIWMMDSDGSNCEKITNGGDNPRGEDPHGVYPIGIDADPDLNPENTKIVFSRLKTGRVNEPFGIYELIVIDIATKEEHIMDSSYANMVPEWKSRGIIFIRQMGAPNPMERVQCLYLYADGNWFELETFPNSVFPMGAYSGSWIEYSSQEE
ncbi:MAG: hypothetical protein HXS53_05040 [Theionarchaea archaeon]|nr:hypothetical protein [Theionarchaea archaeon]